MLALCREEFNFCGGTQENARGWQLAGERMLLYLKAMGLAPEDQLGLSLEAIRRARGRRRDSHEPLAECMDALWQIIKERSSPGGVPKQYDIGANRRSNPRKPWQRYAAQPPNSLMSRLAHPAIQRQCMISAPMELVPWRQNALRTFEAVRNPIEMWLFRRWFVLGGVGMLLAILVFK
jgi:hypothetical protein